jgi:hypothetical protein
MTSCEDHIEQIVGESQEKNKDQMFPCKSADQFCILIKNNPPEVILTAGGFRKA